MLGYFETWSCTATDIGHETAHVQCEKAVKDRVDEYTQEFSQLISEVLLGLEVVREVKLDKETHWKSRCL